MAGPILCAGITMFSPLNTWEANKGGKRVGIIGIGGLGQMGVRMAKAGLGIRSFAHSLLALALIRSFAQNSSF